MYSKEIRIGTGIVKRGKSYRFTVSLGYDGHGKQIRKSSDHFPHPEMVFNSETGNYKARNSTRSHVVRLKNVLHISCKTYGNMVQYFCN